jgi:tetratricopeptide (TPR) repeat protein
MGDNIRSMLSCLTSKFHIPFPLFPFPFSLSKTQIRSLNVQQLSQILRLPGVDLAIVQFDSDRLYPTAAIGRTQTVKEGDLGDISGALNDFDRALKIDANFTFGYQQRGVFNSNRGESALALADLDRAISLDPHNPLNYEIRGDIKASLAKTKPTVKSQSITDWETAWKLYQKRQDKTAIERLRRKLQN